MSLFRFGPFAVHTERFSLTREDAPVEFPAVPLEILILLLQKRGDLLTRDELARAVWPDCDPADLTHRINMAINRIRTTLGDDPAHPTYIRTVIGKGYRFVAPVEVTESGSPAPEVASYAVAQPADRRRLGRWLALAGCTLLLFVAAVAWRRSQVSTQAGGQDRMTQITFNESENRVTAAAISPDGERIAYSDADGVRLKGLHQPDSQPVKTPPVRVIERLGWFSDQQHIAMSGVNATTNVPETWVLSSTGGEPTRLKEAARYATPAPFGTRVAFTDATSSSVWCMDGLGHPPHLVLQGTEHDVFPVIAWSPNGRTLLVQRSAGRAESVYEASRSTTPVKRSYLAVDTETGEVTATVDDLRMDDAVVTPAGVLVFTVLEPRSVDIWNVPINTTTGALLAAPLKVQTLDRDLESITISAAGQMAVVDKRITAGIMVGDFDAAKASLTGVEPFSASTRASYPHAWTPDSSSLYFESRVGDNDRLFRQRVGAHDPIALTSAPNFQAIPMLTPDHRFLLFIGTENRAQPRELYRLPLSGGAAERVDTKGPMGEMRCPLFAGMCVLRRAEDKQRVAFYQIDPVQGISRVVYSYPWVSEPLGAWGVSPDGTKLALGTPDAAHAQISVIDLSSGAKQTIPADVSNPIGNVAWTANGTGWFLSTRTALGSDLYYLKPSGHATLLRQVTGGSWVVPAPDGRKVAFGDQRIDSNVWILKE
jgi:DNA-binding winged helix-turn-helix (wHTH) protein/Tol biopolymer transport system component